jgi:predicted DnaQ family exonuclease/DinG family helicase
MTEYVALDFETTGLDPRNDRVIEVGGVAFTNSGEVVNTFEQLADPQRSVPAAVLRLTGIDRRDLIGAASWEQVLREVALFSSGRQPIAHGGRLEFSFLQAAGLWPPDMEMLDTLDLARILLPDSHSHSLPRLAGELGLTQPRPHRALDDAHATRQLLLALKRRAEELSGDLKQRMLELVEVYEWPVARFLAGPLAAPSRFEASRPVQEVQTAPGRRLEAEGFSLAVEELAALAGPDGPLARTLPGYEHREGQLEMLRAVAQAMSRGLRLVVEAGTGTGKSLAYLIPALAHSVGRGERVVLSTYTHTLQEQLMSKDIPGLKEWLPWEFRAALLKGRANYLSLRRWRRYLAEPCRSQDELCFKLKILVWLEKTQVGDRSELRLHGQEEGFWARVASDPLDCVGVRCRPDDCFVHRARARAEAAHLVVVNHALLLADGSSGGGLLPDFEHLVVDEAHHLEDAATQGLRLEVEGSSLVQLLDRLASRPGERRAGLLPDLLERPRLGTSAVSLATAEKSVPRVRGLIASCFETATDWARLQRDEDRRDGSLRITPEVRERPGWKQVAELAADASTGLAGLSTELFRSIDASNVWFGGEEPDQHLRELEIIRGRLAEAELLLREAIVEPGPNRVYWFAFTGRAGTLVLRSAPIEVGSLLQEQVLSPRRSVILTSASLAVAGKFDFFCRRSGVGEGAMTLSLDSPFDYLRQALICLPTDLPDPGDGEFEPLLAGVVAQIAARLQGRTLALFTSHQQLREVYERLKLRPDLDSVLILGQGIDGPRPQLLKTFQEVGRALLLGTTSFWEGIDLPGDQLSCVVVVRLPFPVPSEPVYAARAERLRDPFAEYALPQAVLRLKQGFGRLIRHRSDRGAVVILDGRILRREYGQAFLQALPQASRRMGPAQEVPDHIERWLS